MWQFFRNFPQFFAIFRQFFAISFDPPPLHKTTASCQNPPILVDATRHHGETEAADQNSTLVDLH